MSILQTIDSTEYVCWSFRKSKKRNGKLQKRKAGEEHTTLQLLLPTILIIAYATGESRKTLRTGREDACNQLPMFRFQQDSPDQKRAGKEMELRRVRSSTIRQGAPGSEGSS